MSLSSTTSFLLVQDIPALNLNALQHGVQHITTTIRNLAMEKG